MKLTGNGNLDAGSRRDNPLGCKSSVLGKLRVEEEIHPSMPIGTKREVSGRERAGQVVILTNPPPCVGVVMVMHRYLDCSTESRRFSGGRARANADCGRRYGRKRRSDTGRVHLAPAYQRPYLLICRQRAAWYVQGESLEGAHQTSQSCPAWILCLSPSGHRWASGAGGDSRWLGGTISIYTIM